MASISKQADGTWTIDPPRRCEECKAELPDYAVDVLCLDCLMRHAEGR
jgi:hypothetical protein